MTSNIKRYLKLPPLHLQYIKNFDIFRNNKLFTQTFELSFESNIRNTFVESLTFHNNCKKMLRN